MCIIIVMNIYINPKNEESLRAIKNKGESMSGLVNDLLRHHFDRSAMTPLGVPIPDETPPSPKTTEPKTFSINGGKPFTPTPGQTIPYEGKTPPDIAELFNKLPNDGESSLIRPDIQKITSEPLALPDAVSILPDADDIRQSNAEYDCCEHPSRPCKHWVWDSVNGDGYKNTLSGRYREAD